MGLSTSESAAAFIVPITKYKHIGVIQREFLKRAVVTPNDSLSATRLLALMFDTHLGSLMGEAIDKVVMENLTQTQLDEIVSLQNLFDQVSPFETILRSAVNESEKFLPPPTVDVLRDYNTDGSPLERLGVGSFVIMATNLQD